MSMHIKALSILVFTAALTVPQAYAGQDYIVTLSNGNTITANSYRLEGRKVYLKFPVGEVAIPASEVAAVTTGDGRTLLLQVNGDLKPSSDGTQEAAPPQAAIPGQPSEVQEQGQSGQPSEVQEQVQPGQPPEVQEQGQPGQPSEVQEQGPEPTEIGVPDNPGVSGPDGSMDH